MKVLFVDDGCDICKGEGKGSYQLHVKYGDVIQETVLIRNVVCDCVKAREAVAVGREVVVANYTETEHVKYYEIIPKEE